MNEDERRAKRKKESLILLSIGYLVVSIVLIRLNILVNLGMKINARFLDDTLKSFLIKPFMFPETIQDLKYFSILTLAFIITFLNTITDKKKYLDYQEYGSAKWSKFKDIKPFIDKEYFKNILFTETERMSMNGHKTRRNCNVLVVGGSGTGKSRFYVKPNLMQMHSSYVVTDPKGELFRDTAKMFKDGGYKIKVFNLYDMENSNKYNPFHYIRNETDILKVVNNFMQNTNPPGKQGGDPFWEKSEKALLEALFAFIWLFLKKEEQNFSMVLRLLEKLEVREDMEDYKSDLDVIMEEYSEKYPGNFSWKQWCIYKQAGGKTAKSINVSTAVRLEAFNTDAVSTITDSDEMEIESIGEEKTIVYLLIPDADSTFNFLISMFYQQMFDTLYYVADFKNNGRLKTPVRCIIDEFANIGQIPEFEKKLSTMRSREINTSIIIQNMAQLEALYKDHWKTIIGNCDSTLFLGSNEQSILKYISEMLGKQTIDIKTSGKTKGKQSSTSNNFQRTGRELMTIDELSRMDNKKCILLFRGLSPFFSNKFPIEKHRRYKFLFDENDKKMKENILSIESVVDINREKQLEDLKITEEWQIIASSTLEEIKKMKFKLKEKTV